MAANSDLVVCGLQGPSMSIPGISNNRIPVQTLDRWLLNRISHCLFWRTAQGGQNKWGVLLAISSVVELIVGFLTVPKLSHEWFLGEKMISLIAFRGITSVSFDVLVSSYNLRQIAIETRLEAEEFRRAWRERQWRMNMRVVTPNYRPGAMWNGSGWVT